MRVLALGSLVLFASLGVCSAAPRENLSRVDHGHSRIPSACHPHWLTGVRREWGDLTLRQRRHYIDAVLCLQRRPSQLEHALYNATSRYEDFVVVHMNLTRYVHRSALFFPWHRGYISLFERSLATECGFKGTLPYWDWVKHSGDILASPLFDGSEYSFSGQGLPVAPDDKPACGGGIFDCPPTPGGGCVTNGPFKNYTWGYQAIPDTSRTDPNPGLPADVFTYTPRCFTRDISQYIASTYQTAAHVQALLSQPTMQQFHDYLDMEGLHGAGHLLTGPLNGNLFSSPHEPTFFLHHANIDRLWAQWQAQDPWDRTYGQNAFYGTLTSWNLPPSGNATFGTLLNWGPLGPQRRMRDMLALGRGEHCYKYA